MPLPTYRAWRFVHPDFDSGMPSSGLQFLPSCGMAMVEAASAVRQSIMLLLSTRPGERIMRPAFGCDLHRLVFETCDATTAGLAIHYVRQAITRWEPRAEILRLDADVAPDDPNRLDIVLDYRVRFLHATDRIVFPVNLSPMEA
jgi:phage baseplate assembly protein W